MKVEVVEQVGSFGIEMIAETLAEGALLVRFGLNRTTELRNASARAYQDGGIYGSIVLGKRKQATSYIAPKT